MRPRLSVSDCCRRAGCGVEDSSPCPDMNARKPMSGSFGDWHFNPNAQPGSPLGKIEAKLKQQQYLVCRNPFGCSSVGLLDDMANQPVIRARGSKSPHVYHERGMGRESPQHLGSGWSQRSSTDGTGRTCRRRLKKQSAYGPDRKGSDDEFIGSGSELSMHHESVLHGRNPVKSRDDVPSDLWVWRKAK